jgi:hypothetical protein
MTVALYGQRPQNLTVDKARPEAESSYEGLTE